MNVSAESGAPRRAGQRHEVGLAQLPPAPPTTVAVIEGLATGTPRRVVNQSDAADRVAELFLDPGQRERIPRVYQKSRITTRRMAVDPLDAKFDVFRREPATIRDRMHLFYEHAVPLAVDVSKRALAGLPYRAAEIGLLVLATSTGFTDGIWHSDERFFRRGGSGDWQQFFTEAEHLRYYHRINQLAPPDLLAWAHEGRRGYDPAN